MGVIVMNRRKAILAAGGVLATAMAGCTDDSGREGGGGGGGDGNGGGSGSDEDGGSGGGGGGKITADADSLLPTIEDFEGTGWTAGSGKTSTETSTSTPRASEFASQSFFNDPLVLDFLVWRYTTSERATQAYQRRTQARTEKRSSVDVELGDEAIAYEYGMAIVDLREANVMGRVRALNGNQPDVSEAKERARMMHGMWR
jgi:hypothetical protein